jgi:soluble lytic murein transglycosylase-like protein
MNKTILLTLLLPNTLLAAPKCLEKNIAFWKKVYSEYNDTTLVFHDANTFEVYSELKGIPIDSNNKKFMVASEFRKLEEKLNSEDLENVRVQRGAKEKWIEGTKNSKKLLPMIKKVFKKYGVPERISYLPHVESSYDASAGSRVGAKGLWQIMPSTAKLYGVRNISRLYEPTYATDIAAKILLDNYEALGDWDLAINAYHSGQGSLRRAVEETGSRDICVIIEEYKGKTFKFASKNYLGQFYAALELTHLQHKSPNVIRKDKRTKGSSKARKR